MNYLKGLLISAMLTLSKIISPPDEQGRAWEMSDLQEPEAERDEWQRMMHHDDVTPMERAWLESEDPEDIKRAQDAIFQRQEEFNAWWDDKDTRNKAFYGPYHKTIQAGVEIDPIEMHEGWEDDEDMPEYYETVFRINESDEGEVLKVPYELCEKLDGMIPVAEDPNGEKYAFMFNALIRDYNQYGKLEAEDYTTQLLNWEQCHANS